MALPDFLVIGAPKAGSTALHDALVQHPQLFLSNPEGTEVLPDRRPAAGPPQPARPRRRAQRARSGSGDREPYEALFDAAPAGHAARREHAVLPVGPRRAPAHPRTPSRRQADRGHPRSGRPRLLELDPPAVRRARDRARLPDAPAPASPSARRRLRAVLALPRARPLRRAARAPVPASSRASRCTSCATASSSTSRQRTLDAICGFLGVEPGVVDAASRRRTCPAGPARARRQRRRCAHDPRRRRAGCATCRRRSGGRRSARWWRLLQARQARTGRTLTVAAAARARRRTSATTSRCSSACSAATSGLARRHRPRHVRGAQVVSAVGARRLPVEPVARRAASRTLR